MTTLGRKKKKNIQKTARRSVSGVKKLFFFNPKWQNWITRVWGTTFQEKTFSQKLMWNYSIKEHNIGQQSSQQLINLFFLWRELVGSGQKIITITQWFFLILRTNLSRTQYSSDEFLCLTYSSTFPIAKSIVDVFFVFNFIFMSRLIKHLYRVRIREREIFTFSTKWSQALLNRYRYENK